MRGLKVINGDNYDVRHYDPKDVIVGLKYKHVRNKIDLNTTPFVISEGSPLRSEQPRSIIITSK